MKDDARGLLEYCRDRVGDDLRAVITYQGGENDFIYVRDDLDADDPTDDLGPLLDDARAIHTALDRVGYAQTPLGQPRASLHTFDHAFILQLLYPDGGIIVTFDLAIGRDLLTFINQCLEQVDAIPTI